jgi:hypothetical protein
VEEHKEEYDDVRSQRKREVIDKILKEVLK